MIILLHSSKTMRVVLAKGKTLRAPALIAQATQLDAYLKTLTPKELSLAMKLSSVMAKKTQSLIAAWNTDPGQQSPAIDSFIGDIYSGLQALDLTSADREYADRVLFILSGLYGVLRPNDGIFPYRLEMGYRLPGTGYKDLYAFWGNAVAGCLPERGLVVNLAAVEYTKAVLPFIEQSRVITPKFLTVDPKSHEPKFVVLHAKIARGAFARWLIRNRVSQQAGLTAFNDLGYCYDATASTPEMPVFVCQEFGGLGLSVRMQGRY